MQEIHRGLGNGFRIQNRQLLGFCRVPSISAVPEAGDPAGNPQGPWKLLPEKERTLQNRQILGFSGVPSISAAPEAGNPGNPQGPWKWLPEKERTLQNRQLLGFCGVPSMSAVPEAGNAGNLQGKGADSTKSTTFGLLWCSLHFGDPRSRVCRKSTGALEIASGKGADTTKSTTFGLLRVSPSISAVSEAGNAGNPQGPWKWLPEKGADSTKSTPFGLLWFPSISAVPEAGNAGNPQGPWKWLPEKERTLQNQQILGFCGSLHFGGHRSRKSSKSIGTLEMVSGSRKSRISIGALEMASGKRADFTKSTNFGLLWGSLHFGDPRSRNPGNP